MRVVLSVMLCCCIAWISCTQTRPSARTQPGSDADAHGCKASAGYQWSELSGQCIRAFELPLRARTTDTTSLTAFLISSDASRAEVFTSQGRRILNRQSNGSYLAKANDETWLLHKKADGAWWFDWEKQKQ